MWTAVNQFSRRVASFDKTVFLTHDVINVVTRHFRDIRYADRRYKNCDTLSVCIFLTYFLSQILTVDLWSDIFCASNLDQPSTAQKTSPPWTSSQKT